MKPGHATHLTLFFFFSQNIGHCAGCQFIGSQLQIYPFCLLCENVSGPLNIFLLPTGTVLSFVNRECWRDIAEGKSFASCFLCACFLDSSSMFIFSSVSPRSFPIVHPLSMCGFTSTARLLQCTEGSELSSRQPRASSFSLYLSLMWFVAQCLGGTLPGEQLFIAP